MKIRNAIFTIIAVAAIALTSCEPSTPKPYGYFRIDLPEHEYVTYDSLYPPCTMEISKYSKVMYRNAKDNKSEWIDIVYPDLNGRIYCSYTTVKGNFRALAEDSRNLVYKHTIRADAIIEHPFENKEAKVYGIMYEITGNAASPLQFVLTDSTKHFLRGALYFNETPNADSIAPISKYVEEDVQRLIESVRWKN